jgi:hypothetical protein
MSLAKTTGIIAGTASLTIALGSLIISLAGPKQPEAFTLAPLAKSTPIATPAPTPATIAPVAPKPNPTPAPKVVIKEVVKVIYVPAPTPATIAPTAPKPAAPPAPSNVCVRQCEADITEAATIVASHREFIPMIDRVGIVDSMGNDGYVKLRATPKGTVLRKMPNGTAVTILDGMRLDGKAWLKVSINGATGWMIGTGFKSN